MKVRFKDAPLASLLMVEESMADGFGGDEIRRTFYTRREGDPHLGKFLPASAVGIVQGSPADIAVGEARYVGLRHFHPTFVHEATLVVVCALEPRP